MDWITVLLIAAAAQCLLLCGVVLAFPGGNHQANRYLATFLLASALTLTLRLAIHANLSIPALVMALFSLVVFKGPLLFYYVRRLSDPEFRFPFHHLPTALLLLLPSLVFAWLVDFGGDGFSRYDSRFLAEMNSGVPLLGFFTILVELFFIRLSLRELQRHRSRVEQAFSTLEPVNLGWLRLLLMYIAVFDSILLSVDLLRVLGFLSVEPKVYIVIFVELGAIYLISFGGLRQPVIFTHALPDLPITESNDDPQATSNIEVQSQKYARSGMADDQVTASWHSLQNIMQTQKPHLNSDLRLAELADLVGLSMHDLSRVINSCSGKNFYEMVCEYRVEEAKALLSDPCNGDRKMLDIALSSGFNSPSSFYTQFKKLCGVTPKQFQTAAPKSA